VHRGGRTGRRRSAGRTSSPTTSWALNVGWDEELLKLEQELEARIGKPVVTSTQAALWPLLRLAGVDTLIDGFGPAYAGIFRMRIAIFGTGGAGGYFGAQLARAGEDVVFIARGPHLQAIRTTGLRLDTPAGEIVIQPARATDDPAQVGEVDAVLLGVKAWQVTEAAETLGPMIGPETMVVPLQNGVEAPSQLAAQLGAGHVLAGLCGTFSWVTAPGRIRSIGASHFIKFGELDNRPSERTELLRRVFERASVQVEIPADIHKALWDKFLLVVSFGGMGALMRAPIGVIRTMSETRRLLECCMQEVDAVAEARRVALAASVVADTMAFLDSLAENATTSLQRDIIDGKPSELEAWNGAVVRLAREAGIAVPTHEAVYYCLLPQELRARGRLTFPV
jgi:2-dehydropantoate 2-reductase